MTKSIFLPIADASSQPAEYAPVDLVIKGAEGELRLADVVEERGNAGITGYKGARIAINKDYNSEYAPYRARGCFQRHGLYHQAWLESPAYRRGWNTIVEGLVTGHWAVRPAKGQESPEAQRRAEQAQAVLFGLDGGWTRHVEEALYALVSGFAPFIRVVDGTGQLRKLAFRFSHTVAGWITDADERDLVAVRFTQAGIGDYAVLASDLVLYQICALGNDFEGISPMRTVYKFIQAHQLFSQLEALAAEKYGTPWAWVERPQGNANSDADDDELLAILDDAVAADNPILLLPNGVKINITSPAGQMPDFEPAKRYCDEQIATVLKAEGALVGLNGMGSYSMAEVKDDQQIRSLWYYAQLICRVINGEGARAYTGVIRQIVDHLGGPVDGVYPELTWAAAADAEEETVVDQILAAKQAGAVTWGEEEEAWLRERLKMPARVKAEVAL